MMSPRSLLPLTLLLLVTPTNASTVEDNDATPVQLAQAYPMGEPIPAPPSVPRTAPPIPAAPSIPRKAPSIAPPPLAAGPAVAGPFEDGEAAFSKGDYATALRLWQPLAQQGDARAQNGLGALYQRGLGVPQDLAEAMRWYQKAATPKAPKPGDSDQKESTSNPPEEKTSEFYWKEYERLMKFVQSTSGLITESGSDDYRRLADTAKQRAQFLDELESKRLTDIGRYQGYPSTTDSFVFWVLDTRTGEVRRCSTGGCFSQERP